MFRSIRLQPLRSFKSYSQRFGSTLAFIEAQGDSISSASLSSLNAAKQIGNPIIAILLGSSAKSAAENLQKIDGLDKILLASNNEFDHNLPEYLSPVLTKLIQDESKDISHFITPATAVGKNILPRIGALLDSQPVSDIIKVQDSTTFVRPIYAGNALTTVKSLDSKVLISARPSAFDPVQASGSNSYPIEELTPEVESSSVEWVSENLVKSERPDLSSAKSVVAGGRGLKSKENFDQLITPLADALGAGIGATRAAVDSGFTDNSLQVGQTGKVVAPDLYVAVGVSGAIQHLAGMKDSKTIVAINKDEEAPIFNVADIGLVGDLFEVVPELTEKVK
ncbi:Electron transfer flavoprotein subunit alpha,mitochondrial [Wickerhamomyces ciferrii]|uniref:Probable electron transfer flavoprotein subunit alpha n=1 Tax=Wickerhamomyces ciferrii (strain ATCC 14091 / BCRC 22168 / CBS 111 / JCM 3599 / NBRC 0793 / NRRL Y-1031 F-60-10) TaxID=1206466 RepID=K0KS97_WICCF|nr:Electron transfer flavoprotein subunit alpha,mitochondrial [Wickerhamomyces ciferrii]CCH44213.1 Electron transfer flavoprotein subunit alpha,mitochondrial [Wickerhamomyces ciferrii]